MWEALTTEFRSWTGFYLYAANISMFYVFNPLTECVVFVFVLCSSPTCGLSPLLPISTMFSRGNHTQSAPFQKISLAFPSLKRNRIKITIDLRRKLCKSLLTQFDRIIGFPTSGFSL